MLCLPGVKCPAFFAGLKAMTMDYDKAPRTHGRTTGSPVGCLDAACSTALVAIPARLLRARAATAALAYADAALPARATAKA
jgi:hypothetical protein